MTVWHRAVYKNKQASRIVTGNRIAAFYERARQGERGFDRGECTKTYTTKAKRKFDTVLRSLEEEARIAEGKETVLILHRRFVNL